MSVFAILLLQKAANEVCLIGVHSTYLLLQFSKDGQAI